LRTNRKTFATLLTAVSKNIPAEEKQVRSNPKRHASMQNIHNQLKYGSFVFGFNDKLNMVFIFNYTSTYACAVNAN
jgi:hypothetical protein